MKDAINDRALGAPTSRAKSEDRIRLLLDSVRDYAIFLLDTEGRIETWSAGAQAIKGYTADEIVGRSLETFYTEADRRAGRPRQLLRIAAETGRVEDEGWRVRKDGTRFWADVVITALRDEAGRLVGFGKVTRDLSERRAQDEQLRASEERFRLLVQSVKEYAIFMLDPQGRVATWNEGAQRIKGYTEAEILGSHVSRFYLPEDAVSGKADVELGTAEREGVFEEEGWRVRKDGSRFWANVVLTAIRDENGQLLGFAKVTRDLTERRHFEEERLRLAQAEEAVRLRDEFLSIASHELRTPLTALQLQLEDMRARFGGNSDRLAQRIDRAARSGERLVQLTDTLLDVSRIATGRMELQKERTDLGEAVRDVVERLSHAAANAHCELRVEGDGALVGVWDRLRIEQVVMNLLSNSLKFGAGAPVTMALAREDDCAVLRVCDGGPGIPPTDLQRIFGRFERAAPVRHFGGFGLGLYVTQQIVAAHGGSVEASNRSEGGACFTVRLPLSTFEGGIEREAC